MFQFHMYIVSVSIGGYIYVCDSGNYWLNEEQ